MDWLLHVQKILEKKDIKNPTNINELKKKILLKIPKEWKKYESILVEPIFMKKLKKIKILKKGFWEILKNPRILFKNTFNIEDQFDLFHGSKYLKIGVKLLEENEKVDFAHFLKKNNFNPYNMFFCKNYKILERYYRSVFPWLSESKVQLDLKI